MEITTDFLADLKAKAQAATPGPWQVNAEYGDLETDEAVPQFIAGHTEEPNAAFMAAASPDVVMALIEHIEYQHTEIERLEFDKRINLKMIGEDAIFRFKIVKILLAMSRRLNLLPEARQTGFFHEDASLDDISVFAEKCLERIKEAHNRDSLIENLGKEKVNWQETAETLDSAVNSARKTFENIRRWMESLCLALGISLGELKGKATSQAISAAIKKLIHDKAWLEANLDALEEDKGAYYKAFDNLAEKLGVFKETDPGKPETFEVLAKVFERLEKEADWLAEQASLMCDCIENCDECRLFLDCQGRGGKEIWREAARKAVEGQ